MSLLATLLATHLLHYHLPEHESVSSFLILTGNSIILLQLTKRKLLTNHSTYLNSREHNQSLDFQEFLEQKKIAEILYYFNKQTGISNNYLLTHIFHIKASSLPITTRTLQHCLGSLSKVVFYVRVIFLIYPQVKKEEYKEKPEECNDVTDVVQRFCCYKHVVVMNRKHM
ncbi:hypothetical protein FF38_10623 [Lucilia cuprina]|uniref:Uncharacterized protein n=1 Tax=Lucilia cuprina TaxID=7375 RepID=A0A0L0CD08_LUCCU|nr:hypothetical protein FF38_10623 [Lucilia cuprina]